MSTIDDRIVQMTFDNGQFEKGVQTSIKSLDDLKKGLDLDKSAKSLDGLAKAAKDFDMGNLSKNVEFLAKRFSNLGIVGMTALQNITNYALNTGKQLLKSLTIDQVTTGFSKYEQKTAAVQTIMAATGKSIGEVNQELGKLVWFTDETSYNFVDMVGNIGKFTASGVKLGTAVTAMQGIANWAAISGQGTNEASRAMYNLAQSIGMGVVKLQDWKSIENANMATLEFKQTVIDTAKELKVLDEKGRFKGAEVTAENFSSTLQKGWFTSEVLLKSLDKYGEYANEVFKIVQEEGLTAAQAMAKLDASGSGLWDKPFKAAQEAKTFTDAMNAVKDAVSSGWMTTFEHIFGNYEKAKVLWTDLANELYDIFAESGNARNELLAEWDELGGREDLFQGLFDTLEGLKNIGTAVGDAFRDIFPETTVDTLLAMSKGVKEFGANLKKVTGYIRGEGFGLETKETVVKGKEPEEFLSELKRGKKAQSAEDVKKLQEHLAELGYDLGKTGADGIFGPRTEAALKAFQKDRQLLEDGIYKEDVHANLMEALGFTGGEEIIIERISATFNIFGDTLKKVQSIVRGASSIFSIALKVFGFFGNAAKHVWDLLEPLRDVLLTIAAAIGDAFTAFNAWIEKSGFFEEKLAAIKKLLEPFGTWVNDAAKSLLAFFGLGDKVGQNNKEIMTFGKLWENVLGSLRQSGVLDKISGAFERIKATLMNAWEALKGFWETVLETFKGGEEWEGINWAGALASSLSFLADAFAKFLDFVAPVINWLPIAFEHLGNAFKWLWPHVSGFVAKIPGWIGGMKDFFVGLYKQLMASEKFQGILSGIKGFWEKFKEFLALLWEGIKGFFSADVSEGTGFIDGLKERLKSFSTLGEHLSEVFGRFWSHLTTALNGINDLANKVGPGGIVGIVGLFLGFSAIGKLVKAITGVTKGIGSIVESLAVFKHGYKPVQSFSSKLLQIAGAIALIVGSIYLIGNMDTDALKQGAITIGVIMAALVGLSIVFSKIAKADISKGIDSFGKSLFQMGIGLAAIAAAIWLIGSMDPKKLGVGLAGVGALLFMLNVFMKSLGKVGGVNIQLTGFFTMALALGVLAVIARLIGGINQGKFWAGVVRLAGVMAIMAGLMFVMGKVGASTIQLKGFFTMAIALGVLALVARLIGGMDQGKFWIGMGGLTVMMAALAGFSLLLGKVETIKTGGLLGMVAILGLLTYIIITIGAMSWQAALQGVAGISAVMLAFAVMMKMVSKVSISKSIGSMLNLIALAGVMWVLGDSLSKIKDVPTDKIIAFAAGLSAMMLSLGGLMMLSKGAGLTGLGVALLGLIGLAAVIAGVIWAFGKLAQNQGFNEGFVAIGEMIGKFVGAMKAAEMSQMTKGLSSFDGFTVDKKGIQNAIDGASMLDKFARSLPEKTIGKQLADFFTGSNFKGFSNDITWFGIAMNSFSRSMESLAISDTLGDQTQKAIDAAMAVKDFAVGLPESDETIWTALNLWPTKMESFADEITAFAEGMRNFVDLVSSMDYGTDLSEKSVELVDAAERVNNFAAGLPDPDETIWTQLRLWPTKMTSFKSKVVLFSNAMMKFIDLVNGIDDFADFSAKSAAVVTAAISVNAFAAGLPDPDETIWTQLRLWPTKMTSFKSTVVLFSCAMTKFAEVANGIEDPGSLAEKATAAKDAATEINEFAKKLPPVDFGEGLTIMLGWPSAMSQLNANMQDFAGGFGSFAEAISGIDAAKVVANTLAATLAATALSGFLSSISNLELDKRSGWDKFWGVGETSGETFLSQVGSFGESMRNLGSNFDDIDGAGLEVKMASVMRILQSVADFIQWISSDEVKTDDSGFDIEGRWNPSSFTKLINNIQEITTVIKGFSAEGINTEVFSAVIGAIASFAQGLAALDGVEITLGGVGTQLRTVIESIVNLFKGDDIASIDPSAFLNGLDPQLIAAKVAEASEIIAAATTTASERISGATSQFNTTGAEMGSAMASGFSGDEGTTAVELACNAMLSALRGYVGQFTTAGYNMSKGLALGIAQGASLAIAAAINLAKNSITAAKNALGEASPSREFIDIGENVPAGMAIGVNNMAHVATKATENMGNSMVESGTTAMGMLSDILASDIDFDPVIRPVVDLSSVEAGARSISGLFSGRQSVGMEAMTSRATAASIKVPSKGDISQNGSNASSTPTPAGGDGVTLTGNTFIVRNDNDARLIAQEIAALTRQGQRSMGAPLP